MLPLLLLLIACGEPPCLDGDGCEIATPCEGLAFTCESGFTAVRRLGPDDPDVLRDPFALASEGDYVLENDHLVAVIDAPDHPHYIAPSGGTIVDLYVRDAESDSLRQVFQTAGFLPNEAALYTEARIVEDGDVKAIELYGSQDGRPENRIATRYEIRPCEPGLRVRTELLNGGADPESWFLVDAWYFGDRDLLPFVPTAGVGYSYPEWTLSTLGDAVVSSPWMGVSMHVHPENTYATAACDLEEISGFHNVIVSAVGPGPNPVQPRDWRAWERFVAVAPGPSLSSAIDVVLGVREQLFGEPFTELSGQLVSEGGSSLVGTGLRGSIVVLEGTVATPPEERVPWSQVEPDEEGFFALRVPTDRSYVLQVHAYGQVLVEREVAVGSEPVDAGVIESFAPGELTVAATVDGEEVDVLVTILPADTATAEGVAGQLFGQFSECAPLLGHPHGPSPACNRVLVGGPTTLTLLPGNYDVYGTVGPFATIGHVGDVSVVGGQGESITLELRTLDLQPEGTLSGDFHIPGAASFDTPIPDVDRVRAFLASGVDVIATTEHDTVWDYREAIETLDAADDLRVLVGTEQTGHILWNLLPDDPNPKVVGHWNIWPLAFDPDAPWRGAPWDEKAHPGELFTRAAELGWTEEEGVLQLNHPLSGLQFGRAFGWADSLELDGNEPLKTEYDGTGQSTFLYHPPGAQFGNADFHTQEFMNGSGNGDFLKYRAFWFYLMDQGIFRAGTANSDSHSLTEHVVGTPRTLVWTEAAETWDPVVFNDDLKAGHSIGTNGPVVLVETRDADGGVRTPGLEPFVPDEAATLDVTVRAAPWVPVDELRVFVNGERVHQVTELARAPDPFGTEAVEFYQGSIPLADLLPPGEDAWLVVEAGPAHRPAADLDCDAFPDTTDNDGDGTIDWRDVADLEEDPGTDCLGATGPLRVREVPEDRDDPLYHFAAVVPEGYPLSITNPLVMERNGEPGFQGVLR